MKLADTILANQKSGLLSSNQQLVGNKLKDLVFEYTDAVLEVLHKCGIIASTVLPPKVVLAIVIKHIGKNQLLRETIAKMLLEMDGFYNATGTGVTIIGGALSAVGSVLAGIGRGQINNNTDTTYQVQNQLMMQQQQQQLDADKRRRTAFVITGISLVVILSAILIIRSVTKAGQVQPKLIPQV